MQGIFFVSSCWLLIIFCLSYKNKFTNSLLIVGLLFFLLSCSTFTFEIFSVHLNVSYFAIIFIVSYLLSLLGIAEQFGKIFKGLVIGMCYSSMTILFIYDPASFFINQVIAISLIIIFLCMFLSKNFTDQIIITSLGLIQGEIFNYFILKSIQVNHIIGELNWFDCLFLSILVITSINAFSIFKSKKSKKSLDVSNFVKN